MDPPAAIADTAAMRESASAVPAVSAKDPLPVTLAVHVLPAVAVRVAGLNCVPVTVTISVEPANPDTSK